ncbi:MAG: hypothetical protein M3P85_14685 [Actinomycetota bacterium]|nr:hypothetical protein [Actinomycetota bacterium]
MTVLALLSAKHSPGVTTSGLAFTAALAEEGDAVLIEADPAGGDVAVRVGLALDPGLVSLASAGRHDGSGLEVDAHTQALPAGGTVVVGPTTHEQANRAVSTLAGRLSAAVNRHGSHAVVDCGRWVPGSPVDAELATAETVLVVVRPSIEGIEHVRGRLPALVQATPGVRLGLLLVGDRPYRPEEVHAALGVGVLGVIPVDDRGAAAVAGAGSRRVARRCPLVRSARSILDGIAGVSRQPAEARA